jgi:geranylgeranyl reductase family protein
MERCDVLIVGGGPAGSSCAWKLAGSGLDVLVLDRKSFPRDKPCAGWITPALIESLQLDLDDYRRGGRVLQPITSFVVGMMGGREVEAAYDKPISYGIRRFEFDDYLLRRSKARLRLGEGVKSLERDGPEWVVNGEVRAKMLVGAGGHFCPVARHLGAKETKTPAVVAQEIEFELSADQIRDCPVRPGVPYLHFCPDLRGYGWYFRKGYYLNVGLGREDDEKLSDHVAEYVESLKASGRIPRDLPARFPGHAYLLYPRSQRPVVGDAVLLAGDAAGTAYSPSGEGIRPAVESGLMAGDLIAALDGDYRRERLQPYAARFTKRFGDKAERALADLLPAGLKRLVAGRLMAWGWFSRSVVVDQWFLRRSEPVLQLQGRGPID